MWLLLFWIFQVILSAALGAETGTHFHRKITSDYKPQHNPKTQKDYKRHSVMQRAVEQKDSSKTIGTPLDPEVVLSKSHKKVMLHQLIVRIYQDNEYRCVGTQIAEMLVITAVTCFDEPKPKLVTMKTYSDQVITGHVINQYVTHVLTADNQLALIMLDKRPDDSVLINASVLLCTSKLLDNSHVEMPIWIRKHHRIQSRNTRNLPLHECQYILKDDQLLDNMICVKNDLYTPTCQKTIGNPLIHNNMICGVNYAEHNCPHFTGIAMYSAIYDRNEYQLSAIRLMQKLDVMNMIL
ncbi:hypothetical protein KR032_000596 [Drosophila birchii]|nr:hypothetical protein KR032_000596 [Drosophila birchii]